MLKIHMAALRTQEVPPYVHCESHLRLSFIREALQHCMLLAASATGIQAGSQNALHLGTVRQLFCVLYEAWKHSMISCHLLYIEKALYMTATN